MFDDFGSRSINLSLRRFDAAYCFRFRVLARSRRYALRLLLDGNLDDGRTRRHLCAFAHEDAAHLASRWSVDDDDALLLILARCLRWVTGGKQTDGRDGYDF